MSEWVSASGGKTKKSESNWVSVKTGEVSNYVSPIDMSKELLKNPSKMFTDQQKTVDALTRIPSANYNGEFAKAHKAATQKPTIIEKTILSESREKVKQGKALSETERTLLSKFGVVELELSTTANFMDFVSGNSNANRNYNNTAKELLEKQKKGTALTPDEEDMLATAKLVSEMRREVSQNTFGLTDTPAQNAQTAELAKATEIYSKAAYGTDNERTSNIEKNMTRTKLYVDTGIENFFSGYATGINRLSGMGAEEIAEMPDSANTIASGALREYYGKNQQKFNIIIQDVVTNMAQNAIPMLLSAATMMAGGASGSVLGMSSEMASRIVSVASFAPSVFGNAYKEATKYGITSEGKLLAYAGTVTAAECGLEYLLGSSVNPAGGVMSGEIIEQISKKINSVVLKAITKIVGNGVGEFTEETIQGLLSPILQKYILGADVKTVFDDPFSSLSSAAYDGFIGFLSSMFMGGVSNVQSAISESNLQKSGAYYKYILKQTNIDIKDIATYFKEISTNKDFNAATEKVLKGDISDLAVGEMLSRAVAFNKESLNRIYADIGQKVLKSENGVDFILKVYEATVKSGAIYPENVNTLYEKVKENSFNGVVDTVAIGEFAFCMEVYSPKAHIMGRLSTVMKQDTQTPELQSNANGDMVIDEMGDDGVAVNSQLPSGQNGGIINDTIGKSVGGKYTPEQRKAAVLRYKSGESYIVNAKLREDVELDEAEQEFVDTLDEALSQLPTYEGTVYRNLTFDDFGGEEAYNDFLSQYIPNKLIIYDQFVSCSKEKDGYPVDGEHKIQLVIESKTARDVDGYGNNMESEVIYPLSSYFIVDKIDNNGENPVIYLQEVSSDGYNTNEEQGNAMRDMQELHFKNGDLQGVSERNTTRDTHGSLRPQPAPSERQRDTVRTRGGQGTVLSTARQEQGKAGLTPETNSFFDEPSADFPEADFIQDAGARLAGVERHSDGQRTIIEIGRKLGYKVIFDPDLKNRKGALANGKIDYDNKTIYLNPKARKVKQWILKHELVHYGKQRNTEAFNAYKEIAKKTDTFYDWIKGKFTENFVNKDADFKNWLNEQGFTENKRNKPAIAVLMLAEVCDKRIKDYAQNGENIGRAKAEEEIIGDFSGDVIFSNDEKGMEKLLKGLDRKQHNAVVQFVLDFISYLKEKFTGNKQMTLELKLLESRYIDMLREAKNNPTTQGGGVDYSFEGYAEDGKGKYKSNFPKGTPKAAKGQRILTYIQKIWSKKPIRLKIVENGETRYIEAKFDPTYDESGNIPTDASKLMGGNRHGISSEQRVTLDLADDYYQIASESQYNYSKAETGKENPAHNDVKNWHYFINDIYFAEYGSEEYEPYRVSINIKERADGDYVYSFSAEKQRESDTPRTLHAVVNDGGKPNANVELSNNRVTQKLPVVNTYSTQENEDYSLDLEENYESYGGENLHNTPQSLMPESDREWSAFNRSFANQTSGMKSGESKTVSVFTAKAQYIIAADGYMSGTVVSKADINDYNERIDYIGNNRGAEVSNFRNEKMGNRQRDYGNSSNPFERDETDSFYVELDTFIREHSNQLRNIRQDGSNTDGRTAKLNKRDNIDYSLDLEERPETATENGVDIDTLLDRYDRGEISREDFTEQLDTLWGEAVQQYGAISEGESAVTPIPVPKAIGENQPVERFIRTVIETGKLNEKMFEGISADILLGNFSYTAVSDEKAIKKAEQAVLNKSAENRWDEVVMGRKPTKDDIAIGEMLLTKAIDDGDTRRVMEVSSELADILTQAGQVVQAARLLKKMTGAGRLVSLQRTVKTLNRDLHARHKNKPISDIKIPETLARQLATAKSSEDIETVYQDILQTVANQMPVTFMDKLNAWRYFAMLCNPRTHIRNLAGNTIFLPAVRIKDFIAYGIESAFVKNGNRTKVLSVKKEYADFARADARRKDVKALLKGNKYNDKSELREKQRIFKTAALEYLTTFNSGAMEAEDALFKNIHYIHALGGFLQARGVDLKTVSEEVLTEARIYAANEARKATFNDESVLAKKIQKFAGKNIATEIFVEGNLPFKQTPINIVKRGVEYSPLGLLTTITKGTIDVIRKNKTATEFIDGISAGLTGSGIMLLGLAAAMWGFAQGGDDDDDRTVFEKMLGKQEYSINLFGKSYTVDWTGPASIPFFIGVEIAEIVKNDGRITIANFTDVIWNALEPITNLSMLSGIQNTISSVRYADSNQIFGSIIGDTLTSYGMQYVPSVLGGVARTVDPKQRTWYVDKNSKLWGSMAQGAINNFKSKVPGLSYTMPEKIDAWGREVDRGGVVERIAENFISPGYYSSEEKDAVDTELIRLGEETGENVYPRTAARSFSVNGETKYLTADEWVKYAKTKGKYFHDYVTEFINSKAYKKLTDDERAAVVKKLYEYANAKAKTTVSEYDLMGDGSVYKTVTRWEKNGKSVVTFYIDRVVNN